MNDLVTIFEAQNIGYLIRTTALYLYDILGIVVDKTNSDYSIVQVNAADGVANAEITCDSPDSGWQKAPALF